MGTLPVRGSVVVQPMVCGPGQISNRTPPALSDSAGPPTYDGHTIKTTDGAWNICQEPITSYIYDFLRNGTIVATASSTATSWPYPVGPADIGQTIKSEVFACDVDECVGAMSSNSITVTDRRPNTPTNLSPANGAVTAGTPALSSVFSDPDPGQTGDVTYTIYRHSDGALVTYGLGPMVSSGSASPWTPAALPAGERYDWYAGATDASGSGGANLAAAYFDIAPTVPQLLSPVGSPQPTLSTTTPVLSASASSEEPIYYEFQVATDSGFSNVVADSDWLPTTSTWTVPVGALQDGRTYYWRARAADATYGDVSAFSAASSFQIQLPKLGVNSAWPMWSHGPLAVNEATGNVVLSLPTPSYPTATGSLTFSLTYNTEAPSGWAETTPGLANGWTLSAGAGSMSPPLEVIDHNVVKPTSASAEIVLPDGSSEFYNQVGGGPSGTGVTYLAVTGDGSQLTKNPDGSWTLLDSDGSTYSFSSEQPSGSGKWFLSSAQVPASSSGHGLLSYAFDPQHAGQLISVTYLQSTTSSSGESLNFTYGTTSCPVQPQSINAEVCVQFKDGPTAIPGQVWAYVGRDTNDTSGPITQVYDPRWPVMQLAYNANNQPTQVQNANDLHPSFASPGYNGSHALTVSYDGQSPARVLSVSETNISNQTPSTTSTWSFAYNPGSVQPTAPRASHYGYLVRNDAPAAYYPLDDTSGSTAVDASGNGNNGAYSGSYSLGQAGALAGSSAGSAVAFNGGNVTASASGLDLSPGGVNTVEFWVKWDGTSSVMPFSFSSFSSLWFANGDFGFNTGCGDIYGIAAPSANTWHYVVAEFYNGLPQDGARLWIDGQEKSLSVQFGTPCSRTIGSSFAISGDTTDSSYRMGGSIDEVAVYGYPLSYYQIAAHYAEALHNRTAAGYTTLTPPNQQPQDCSSNCKTVTTYYDNFDHPIETVDTLGLITESGYSAQNELLWSEDADGNPTDYLYGGPNGKPSANTNLARLLLQRIDPDPDGSGPAPRPVTTYRYDEQTTGTSSQGGNPLTGLAGSYWSGANGANQNMAGLPDVRETDPGPGSGVTTFSLPTSYNDWPVWGYSSARWTGDVNIPSGGDYTFSTVSDGGTRLSVDGFNVVDDWTINAGSASTTVSSQQIPLTAGLHQIVLEYEHDPRTVGGQSVLPSITLDWSCSDCSQTIGSLTPLPASDLLPAYANQTSVVSPAGRVSFNHYADPVSGQPDYSMVSSGSFPTVTAAGGQGGGAASNCVSGVGGSGGTSTSGSDIAASYQGGSGGTGDLYCGLGAGTGGGGGSSAGTNSNGNNGGNGVFRTKGDVNLGGPAPTGGGAGGGSQWQPGDGGYPGGAPGGGGGGSGAATLSTGCASYYTAGAGANGKVVITPNLGTPTTYTSAGNYTYPVPNGVTSLTVELWGAGGGGGRGYGSVNGGASGGGGGGGGAYTKTTAIQTDSGDTLSVTVGAGGAPGLNGGGSGCAGSPNGPASPGSAGGTSSVRDTSPALITSYVYDSLGRMTNQYMPKANANATTDSTTGALTSTPDRNYETDYTYYGDGTTAAPPSDCGGTAVDQYGQLESTTQYTSNQTGGVHSTVTVYNDLGLSAAETNGKGDSCLTYDPNGEGLLISQTPYGDQTLADTTTYTYDPNGNQLSVSSNTGTVTNSYDETNRLIDTKTVDTATPPNTLAEESYSYDADGNTVSRIANSQALSGTTCPSATDYCTTYTYDAADQLQSETAAGNTYHFYYDNRGNLRGTQYPTSTPTFSWVDTNPDGWVSDQYNRHGSIDDTTTPATVPSDSSPLADYTYTYDADGKRLSEVRKSGSTNQTTTYSYDNVGRLSQVSLPSGTCRDYSYDLDSNRSQIQEASTGCNGTFNTTTYHYTPATTPGIDQLTSITDSTNNTTSYTYTSDGQVSNQGTTSLAWDGFGRLSTATVGSNTVTYTYDPTGALMSRSSSSPSSTTNYRLGDLFETNASGTITTSYTDGPAGDLASFNGPPSGTPTFLYYDAHGNLAAEANSSGTITSNHTYDPFGAPVDNVPANQTVHRFVGRWNKQYDTTTGFVLMGARPYDPNTGRFLAIDPIPGGSLNNYDYAGQDPINNYDLNGTCWTGLCWASHAATAVGHAFASAYHAVAPRHWKDFAIGVWEGADSVIISGVLAGTTEICGVAVPATGGLALIGCVPAIGAEGAGGYLSWRATVRDFENAYRRKRRHR
ncbi:MAG: RHS repeat-associated core domain-containing protein [Gaiellaceae bacterium]